MKKRVIAGMYNKIKYRHKVAIVIFLFILIPFLILSTFIAKKSWDDKVNSILEQNKIELRISVEVLNTLFLSGLQKLTFINNNSMVLGYLNNENFDDFVNNMTIYNHLKRTVEALVIDNNNISFVIYPVNENVFNGDYIEKLERLEERLKQDDKELIQQIMALNWEENLWRYEEEKNPANPYNRMGYLCCYKKMQFLNRTLAITEIKIKISSVLESIKGTFPRGSSIVYKPSEDSDYIVMQNGDPNTDGQNWKIVPDIHHLNNGNYYVIEMTLNNNPGILNVFIPRSYVMSTLTGFLIIMAVVIVFSITILFFIVELASYLITKRLSRLIDRVNDNIENTNISEIPDSHSTEDDLGLLEDKFFGMLNKISEYYKKMMGYENEKKTLELELLQSRINPHFLYNTLSTMKWNSQNEKMAGIIDSMVKYYRLALNKGDTIVKISQELNLIEEYLKIQKYTYESDFLYIFEVDDAVKELLTIKHLLQPIVENAVLHGINGLDSGGIIKISGELKKDVITLTVVDNGVGMTDKTLCQLLYGHYESKIGGYGIKNVQKRMNLFYGPDAALNMVSVPNKGTTVIMTIPAVYPNNTGGFL